MTGVKKDPGGAVNMPSHYERFTIEPIRFIEENDLTFLEGNIIKYTVRSRFKHDDGGIQDLCKAMRCLDMLISKRLGMEDWWKKDEDRKQSIHPPHLKPWERVGEKANG